jgi:hypothetical protein
MKRLSAQCSVLALVLTLALSAFAKPKSENITLYHDARVNGASLPAGNYVVKYDFEGKRQGKHTIDRFNRSGFAAFTTIDGMTTVPASSQIGLSAKRKNSEGAC